MGNEGTLHRVAKGTFHAMLGRRSIVAVTLICIVALISPPVWAEDPRTDAPGAVGETDLAMGSLDALSSGLDTVEEALNDAKRLLAPARSPLDPLETDPGALLGLSAQEARIAEESLGPHLLEAVARLWVAMGRKADSEELSRLVTDLLPVFQDAAAYFQDAARSGDCEGDVDLRPLGGPPGGPGGIYIADECGRTYDHQDQEFAFGYQGGIFIDLGGDDTYLAQNSSFGSLGGLFIDLDGHDNYVSGYIEGGESPPEGSLGDYGHQSFGMNGIFLDVRGDDSYHANKDTFGAGPEGLFYDAAGNDAYRSGSDSSGNTGSFGYAQGRFIDRLGDDVYLAAANAFGNSRGVFMDLAGNDMYDLRKEGGTNATAVNSFGAFQGGVMVEYAGDDQYWVQRGNGNFGANGVFVDRAGNDWYGRDEARKHNLSGRTSFGYGTMEGVFADLRGDDQYFARDTSFGHGAGTFMDLGGNDAYHVSHDAPNPINGCNVSCDSFGVGLPNPPGGLFLDYDGDDVYETYRTPGQLAARRMFGAFGGAFIERRGDDTYRTGNEAFASNPIAPGLAADLDGDDLYDVLDGQLGATGVFVDDGGSSANNDQMVVAGEASPMIPLPVSLGSLPGPDPVAAALGLEQDLADLIDSVVCSSAPAQEAGVCPFPGASPTPSPTPSPGVTPTPSPTPTISPTPDPSRSPTPTPVPPPPGGRGTYPVSPDDPLFGDDSAFVSIDPTQWAPRKIQAPEAWQEERATGFGIKVAVLDTGVDLDHEDLQCAGKVDVVAGSDVVANDSDPDDEHGHGTHVAGIIGACTNNGIGIAGVAPDATIVPIRVLNAAGSGTDAQLIAGIDRAVAAGAHVINMSLGYPPGKQIINDVSGIDAAIEEATDAGVVLVAAAGNEAAPLCAYPSLAEDIVCVGATDPRDAKSWYSNFPVKTHPDEVVGPAVVAPGGTGQVFCDVHSEEILSTYPPEFDNCDEGAHGYRDLNGTSMASPHVAGVAALVYDRVGGIRSTDNAQTVIDSILGSVDDLGTPGYDPVFGEGRVNALAAVQAVVIDPDPTPTPTPTATSSPSPTTDPSESPTTDPSESPTTDPSESPTTDPSESPTTDPSESPTTDPSESPTTDPSESPTTDPSESPTTDPGPSVPEAPSNLTARAVSSSRIELAWADNSSSETGFAIERSSDGNDWTEIATAGRNATMHLDMGLNADTSYFYRVRALNPSGYSPYSNIASATTMPEQSQAASPTHAPAAPSNLNASPSSPSRVELSWNDNSNNEDGFALERSSDAASWQEITSTARNHTTYLDAGLAPNTTYHYRVRAYNSAGHSAYSAVASATTHKAPSGDELSPTASDPPVAPAARGTATTSIAASRTKTSFNKGFELSGVIERDDNCSGPLEVTISRRIHGTNTYKSVASTAVNGAGTWGLQVVGRRNASYIAQVKDTDTCQGEASAPTDALVKAKIARLRVPANCRGPVRGKVRPNYETTTVTLQVRTRRGWKKIDTDRLDARSRFVLRGKRCGVHRVMWAEDGAANEPAKRRFQL